MARLTWAAMRAGAVADREEVTSPSIFSTLDRLPRQTGFVDRKGVFDDLANRKGALEKASDG